MRIISGNTSTGSYCVYIGADLVSPALFTKVLPSKNVLVVCDETVAKLHLPNLLENLKDFSVNSVVLPSGEWNKDWRAVSRILDVLTELQYDRHSVLLSLGGGVIGDLTGFAASIYMRGMYWVQVPTTLMAQVDAALGGKTGCNYSGVKNLIGTFYQPHAVITDIAFLATLPHREYISALAELVKYGIACDQNFFAWLEQHALKLKAKDPHVLQQAIMRSSEIKLDLVQRDETDHGVRQNLNLGHTFAHAIEAATGFKLYLHGEAVAIGILLAAELAVKLGLVTNDVAIRITKVISQLALPSKLDPACDIGTLINFMMMDKKKKGATLTLILPCAVGEVRVVEGIDLENIEELVEHYA